MHVLDAMPERARSALARLRDRRSPAAIRDRAAAVLTALRARLAPAARAIRRRIEPALRATRRRVSPLVQAALARLAPVARAARARLAPVAQSARARLAPVVAPAVERLKAAANEFGGMAMGTVPESEIAVDPIGELAALLDIPVEDLVLEESGTAERSAVRQIEVSGTEADPGRQIEALPDGPWALSTLEDTGSRR